MTKHKDKVNNNMVNKNCSEKLKEANKATLIEVTTDGKQEPIPGTEPLKKDPKNRWKKLKKNLNNLKSIMDLNREAGFDEEEQKLEEQRQQDEAPSQQMEPQQTDDDREINFIDYDHGNPLYEEPSEQASNDYVNQEALNEMQSKQEDQPNQEQEPQEIESDEGQQEEADFSDEDIINAMKEEGYSDAEIAHVVFGHHFPQVSNFKQEPQEQAQIDPQRVNEAIDMKEKTDVDELFEILKQKKMLELEYRKKELELKLRALKGEGE